MGQVVQCRFCLHCTRARQLGAALVPAPLLPASSRAGAQMQFPARGELFWGLCCCSCCLSPAVTLVLPSTGRLLQWGWAPGRYVHTAASPQVQLEATQPQLNSPLQGRNVSNVDAASSCTASAQVQTGAKPTDIAVVGVSWSSASGRKWPSSKI